MPSGKPDVSVIIPTYNRARYLTASIQSVLNQELSENQKIEVIVVDDGSTDNTAEVIKKFGDKIRYFQMPHSGLPSVVRNFGIKRANADLIAFHDSDDLWLPNKLERQLPMFQDFEVVLSYGNALFMEADGKFTKKTILPLSHVRSGYVFDSLVKENFISTLTVIVRKQVIEELGGFNESPSFRGLEDYELWLKLTGRKMGKVAGITNPVAYYRRHEKNISHESLNHPLEDITFVLKSILAQYGGDLRPSYRQALEDSIDTLRKSLEHIQNTSTPLVSIVMSVYNAGEYLGQAIESILGQTYTNFEFIIIDDGSTDNSFSKIKSFSDQRLKVFRQKNKGLQKALNFGIGKASGKYIARMDQDDISAPGRIEKQVRLLEKNSRIAILGTSFSIIDEQGKFIDHSYHLDRPEDIKIEILTRNPFGHGTIMLRRSLLKTVGLYDEKQAVEDYELWYRILKDHEGMSLAEELYSWRVSPTSMSHGSSDKRQVLIHNFVKKVWDETQLPPISVHYLKDGLKHYSNLGEGYLEQYRFMLATLCLGAFKMRRRLYAANFLLKLLLTNAKIIGPILKLRKDPLSHSYLLGLIHTD